MQLDRIKRDDLRDSILAGAAPEDETSAEEDAYGDEIQQSGTDDSGRRFATTRDHFPLPIRTLCYSTTTGLSSCSPMMNEK